MTNADFLKAQANREEHYQLTRLIDDLNNIGINKVTIEYNSNSDIKFTREFDKEEESVYINTITHYIREQAIKERKNLDREFEEI